MLAVRALERVTDWTECPNLKAGTPAGGFLSLFESTKSSVSGIAVLSLGHRHNSIWGESDSFRNHSLHSARAQ